MRTDEIKLESGDQLYDFVLIRDAGGDGGELIASLRVPKHPNNLFVISKRYPLGELNTHSALQLGDERQCAIEAALDGYARSKKLKII